jgi:hypothetical protein
MKKFIIDYSSQSREDLRNLAYTIIYKYKAPLTAKRYITELRAQISLLSQNAEAMPFSNREFLAEFGTNTKRLNYKEMAVIFGIFNNTVYIHRIVPANSVTSL